MTKYQLTITFDEIDALKAAVQAVADVTDKKKTAADTSTDDDAPAEDTKTRKGRAKTTNGKTENGKPASVREKALQICRDLLENGDESVKKGLKGLRDEFEVKKLSDVPLEAAEQFLAKAQKLKEKFDV